MCRAWRSHSIQLMGLQVFRFVRCYMTVLVSYIFSAISCASRRREGLTSLFVCLTVCPVCVALLSRVLSSGAFLQSRYPRTPLPARQCCVKTMRSLLLSHYLLWIKRTLQVFPPVSIQLSVVFLRPSSLVFHPLYIAHL